MKYKILIFLAHKAFSILKIKLPLLSPMNFRMSFYRYISPRLLNHSHVNGLTYKIYLDPIFISHTHLNSVTQHHINRKTKTFNKSQKTFQNQPGSTY